MTFAVEDYGLNIVTEGVIRAGTEQRVYTGQGLPVQANTDAPLTTEI